MAINNTLLIEATEQAVGGLPWVSQSLSSATAGQHLVFPFSVKSLTIKNQGTTTLYFGFSAGAFNTGNYFDISSGSLFTGNPRPVVELYLSSSGNCAFSVYAELSGVSSSYAPILSSSATPTQNNANNIFAYKGV